jgi:hypothetical protein
LSRFSLLSWKKDGGPESTVSGFFFIEWKDMFSVALLRFSDGTREAYHDHAFNAVSWLLKGELLEFMLDGPGRIHKPRLLPIVTRKEDFHKVHSVGTSWVLSFRGPWNKEWHEFTRGSWKGREFIPGKYTTLTDGRKPV